MKRLTKIKDISTLGFLAVKTRKSTSAGRYELFDKLISMGGLYVKFAQLLLLKLSGERSHMAREFSLLLKKAYDSTPFEPINIENLLKRELGGENFQDFDFVDLEPVAAGSFGQVYKATLKSGETVAIKALRPSVIEDIYFDMRVLKILARLINVSHHVFEANVKGSLDITEMFGKFEQATLLELDYPREADYANELYKRYKDHPNLVIPKTHLNLCSKHLITQQFIDGITLADVMAQKEYNFDPVDYTKAITGSDLRYQLIVVGQSMLESMLAEGSAHGDPHPGNIKLLPDNKVGLMDFGICATAPSDKQAFFALIQQYQKIYSGNLDLRGYTWAIIDLFVNDLTTAIRSLDKYRRGGVSQQIFAAITDAALGIYENSAQDVDDLVSNKKFLKVFNSVINENNRFSFKFEVEQPEFMRATHMFISLMDSLELKHEVLPTVYTNVVNNFAEAKFHSSKPYIDPADALTFIAEWLEKIASKDIYLYQTLSSRITSRSLRV